MKVSPSALAGSALTLLLTGLGFAAPQAPPSPAATERFEKRIRPLLLAQCVACHGPTAAQGGVRLDRPIDAAAARKVLAAVRYEGAVKMPPAGKLPGSDIATLEEWTKTGTPFWPPSPQKTPAGAPGKGAHWAFVPPRKPLEPPADAAGIDAFIRAALEIRGIAPAPAADRRTLLRRLSFDLTGLPPTPQEMAAFLTDKAPGAYERQVDRLLASPRYGERWARHWLDVARYADSNGLDENLAHGYAWRYRDWVVDALNRDLPYDQFIAQQLAGDRMPTDDDEERNRRLVATGFLTLGPKVLAEQDKPKLVMDIVDEQIDVASKAILGLTISCARCHDHKFDPVSTADYYALAGIFKSTKTMANLDFVSRWNERPLTTRALQEKQKAFEETLRPLREAVETARRAGDAAVPTGALLVEASAFVRGNVDRNRYGEGAINTKETPTFAEWEVTLPRGGRWQVACRRAAEEDRPTRLLVNGRLVAADAGGGVTGGWNLDQQRWSVAGTVELPAGKTLLRIERDGAIPHFSRFALVPEGAPSLAAADEALRAAETALRAAEAKRPATPMAMAVEEGRAEDVRIHLRGSTLTLGDQVPRGFPAVLCGGARQAVTESGSGRLELARWLTRPGHPLTARVAVNRVWQHLFGVGLVSTPDNWGVRGERPSHPDLLDWLAVIFATTDGWSQKKLIRRIVLSQTYRQTSQRHDVRAARLDPENRLLWRQSRRRLEAEPLRDSLLFVAGTLDTSLGGTLLTSGDGDYVTNDQSGNAAQYGASRRALYLPVIRNAVYDFFQAFDFGDPSMVNARRASTTVAPQALYLLNSPLVRQQAQAFARSLLRETPDEATRRRQAFLRAYQRLPFPTEEARAAAFLRRLDPLLAPQERDPDKRQEAAWTALCQTLLASNEFLFME